MTTPVLYANTKLVTQAWMAENNGATGNNNIAFRLPRIPDGKNLPSWASTGFFVISGLSGNRDTEVGMMYPVVSVDCFAFGGAGSLKSPFGFANNMAETVARWAIKARPHSLALPGQYPSVAFFTAQLVTEPVERPDASALARVNFSLKVIWGPKV